MSTAGPDPFAREQGRLSVDVWSDVVCPFCYMGDAILEQALEKFPTVMRWTCVIAALN